MIWRIVVILFMCIGISNTLTAQINEKIWNYIMQYRDIAISEMNRTGIPASITLAQALLESGIGESLLAIEGNNHFGIKCHDWTGPSLRYTDDAPNECFRKYNSVYQSYLDHSDFLTGRKRYQILFTYDRADFKRWAKGLKRCGYATNPKYADLLIQKIELYYLHIFDKPNWEELWAIVETNRQLSLGETSVKTVKTTSKPNEIKTVKPEKNLVTKPKPTQVDETYTHAPVKSEATNKDKTTTASVTKPPIPEKTVRKNFAFKNINNLRAVEYTYPLTVADVAAAHQVKIKKLLRYNELDGFTTFEANSPIFLQNKKRVYKGSQSVHQVKAGETIERLAQKYGIKKSTLQKLNLLHYSQEPRTDELIFLKKKRKIPPRVR